MVILPLSPSVLNLKLVGHHYIDNNEAIYDVRRRNGSTTKLNKSSYFRVKLKRIKFELLTEPELNQT